MKLWVFAACAGYFIFETPIPAQTSFQVLEQDLQTVKQQHDQAASLSFTTFISTLDAASQSASQALELYKSAGGSLPDLSPVEKHYEYETPTEKAAREAKDAANMGTVAIVVQVHCGLMRYAALMAVNPKMPGLNDQWLNWLKTIAPAYPQLAGKRALKDVAMRDSVISSYLAFRGWGDSKEGGWAIHDLPQLYRDQVLEPARHPATAATLDMWDTYIAMREADEPDKNKWNEEDEPSLDFDRGADDFAVAPSMEKLGSLDAIIKANPTHNDLDKWITRMRQMIRSYRDGRGISSGTSALPGATPSTPSSGTDADIPAAAPGTTSSAAAPGVTPSAAPSTPSSAAPGAAPVAAPGTPSSASPGVTPSSAPGTPSSGGAAPTPTATP